MPINEIEKVRLIDQIPRKRINKEKITGEVCEKIKDLEQDRSVWISRQEKFLTEWDDYISNKRNGIWQTGSTFHLPITMIHCKALHARLVRSIFGVRPWFNIAPRERLDQARIKRIDQVMHWALTSYVNDYKGIYLTIDDWLWDIVTVGWGVLKLRWETKLRKSVFVENEPIINFDTSGMSEEDIQMMMATQAQQGILETEDVEKERFITVFDGPMLETVNHEDILFPGSMNDGSDLDQAHIISHRLYMSKHELKIMAAQKKFDQAVVKKMLAGEPDTSSTGYQTISDNIKQIRDHYQGVETLYAKEKEDAFKIHEVYIRMDIDEDGYDEEVVLWIHDQTKSLLRWTYLDRISKTGKRPFMKADLIRRPRRSYSIGMVELLHPINREADALHNQRVDYGTLSNMPYGFYRSASGLKPEEIRLEPGVLIPVDSVDDVRFASMPNSTNWGFQEEASLNSYAQKLTSITDAQTGNVPNPVGGSGTATGMISLIEQSGMQIDVNIRRIHETYARVLSSVKNLLDERMPEGMEFRVINPDGTSGKDENGMPMTDTLQSRFEIAGSVDFELTANSANINRELEKQNAMLLSQVLKNPINIQLGLVGPEQIYHMDKNVLDKHGVLDPDKYIKAPELVEPPLSLYDEISSCNQGMLPNIVLNDNHEVKIQGLSTFVSSDAYRESMRTGASNPQSPAIFAKAIEVHSNMMQVIQAQAQLGNVTGLQIAPSLGARVGGQVNQQSGQPQAQQQQPPTPQTPQENTQQNQQMIKQ